MCIRMRTGIRRFLRCTIWSEAGRVIRNRPSAKRSGINHQHKPERPDRSPGLLLFELEAGLVFFEESTEVVGYVEETDPLFVVERDGEAA